LKDKKNILFLSSWYPSRVLPVNGDFIQRHAEAVSLLHNVTVLHVITDPKANKTIEITDKTIQNVRTLIAYIKPSPLKIFSFVKAYSLLLKKAGKFDIVHVNKFYPVGIVALFLKIFKKKPFLISEHHHIYHKPYNQQIGLIEKMLSKLIVKKANFVCPVSNDLASSMQDFGLKGNYLIVPNVVKTEVFFAKKETKNKIFTLLHVSSMADLKNVKGLLEVLAEMQKTIKRFDFFLIGDNSNKYQVYANELAINPENIHFIGQINQKELSNYYRKADVFLLFSNIENLPCVILESFSTGTSVISTDVGGIKEYFPDDFGDLIEKGNKKQLIEKILQLYTDTNYTNPDTMHHYVEENFSSISIAKQFTTLYGKI